MTRLREVVVAVGDVAAATDFSEGLGLQLSKSGTWERGAYAELSDPEGLRVMLVEGDAPVRLTFTVADAAEALDDAVSRGAAADGDVTAGGGGRWATAVDPWGNPLGFWSRT